MLAFLMDENKSLKAQLAELAAERDEARLILRTLHAILNAKADASSVADLAAVRDAWAQSLEAAVKV